MFNRRQILPVIGIICIVILTVSDEMTEELRVRYRAEASVHVSDRNGILLELQPNARALYMAPVEPSLRWKELAISAEDQYFRYHPGVNPVSSVRGLIRYLSGESAFGGSTITQQLTKNLLHHENERTVSNKLIELLYALALEIHTSKDEILTMYLNTAYFGGRIEGIEHASQHYYGKNSATLSDSEIVRLLAMLALPAATPDTAMSTLRAERISGRTGISPDEYHKPDSRRLFTERHNALFEWSSQPSCVSDCALSIDAKLTESIRDIVSSELRSPAFQSVHNASVAVIEVGKGNEPNRMLALVGSPNPGGHSEGAQINMALLPRPIGSTWKPFIYAKAIERGARPYTLIDDREYRYGIGSGFGFYPKNYDGIYRGPVSMHYALANSLNVPAVRALEFASLESFASFMLDELRFTPRQPLDHYQLSLALGGLEMNPLLLAEYFTVFPRGGVLAPLTLFGGAQYHIPMSAIPESPVRVLTATSSSLVTRMLTDRLMGVEQFGLAGNLNLPFSNYAVKTGTTYDYHDSWTVGYTPDVVVVVWIGNADNTPMDQLSGARGAGKIWNDVMHLLFAEGHISSRPFSEDGIVTHSTPEGDSFGLPGDDVAHARTVMLNPSLILEPHDGDIFEYDEGMRVPLVATKNVEWRVNKAQLPHGVKVIWIPEGSGVYKITARTEDETEEITLQIKNKIVIDE